MSQSNGAKPAEIEVNLELIEEQQRRVVKILKTLLADESVLNNSLQNYRWNVADVHSHGHVTGVHFFALHAALKSQFNEIANMTDKIANHIRQSGAKAPGTMDDFIRKARLSEAPGVYPDARVMVTNLVADHESIIRFLHEDIETIGARSGGADVLELLADILRQHEKMVWLLQLCLDT